MTGEKPLKILHVDDEENQLEFTKLFLEQIEKDVEIDSVTDPQEALELQEKEGYDCIVSDYKMIKMNGIQLAQKVREKSDVPFILYTGQGSEEVAELAFSAGVDDYLRKETEPTHYQVLAKRIKHTVEKHRTEELYRKVVEESRDAIVIIVENRVAFLNKAACKLIDVEKPEECVGKDVFEFFIDETEKIFPPSLDNQGNYVIGVNYKTTNGSIKNAEVSISQTNYRGDEAYLCFIRDVTERKRNEDRLNAIYQQATMLGTSTTAQEISETTLNIMESVFEYHAITFHLVEGNSLILMGTRGAPAIEMNMPLTGPGITTKAARETQSILISDVSTCSDFVKGATEANSELAVPAVLNDETIAVLNVEGAERNEFTEDDRKLLETLAYHVAFAFNRIQTKTLRDRENNEKKERLDYALGVLDNAERANTLVTGDLQRSILSILNATGILRIQPDMLHQAIASIDQKADQAHKVSELIRETIAESTIIKGFIEVNQTVRVVLEKNHFPRNIRLKTQYDEGLLIVEMDEEHFTRIINNLLLNAVEAMPGGGSLGVKVTAKNEEVHIDISDTGMGIPEDRLETIFKPFKSTKEGHSGLGLAFCKNAAETAGGSLCVKSSSSKGTTFRLVLPLTKI
ncbi:MAG: ATP-binding protein [Candidatus Bathyarchaeota archaeon]|nr:ATP-binding protein [Candidatus Bathyarchaeota archaeon]